METDNCHYHSLTATRFSDSAISHASAKNVTALTSIVSPRAQLAQPTQLNPTQPATGHRHTSSPKQTGDNFPPGSKYPPQAPLTIIASFPKVKPGAEPNQNYPRAAASPKIKPLQASSSKNALHINLILISSARSKGRYKLNSSCYAA